MRLRPTCRRTFYRGLLALAGTTGLLFQSVLGCDNTEVRTTILGGIQDLSVTLIDAFFISLTQDEDVTPVTVSWLLDTAASILC